MWGEQVGILVISLVILLVTIVLTTGFGGLFLYIFAVGIVGLRRLRKPVTLNDIGVELAILSVGLMGFYFALEGIRLGEDAHNIASPTKVMQGLNVAMVVLGLLSAAIGMCGAAILVVDYFLHPSKT